MRAELLKIAGFWGTLTGATARKASERANKLDNVAEAMKRELGETTTAWKAADAAYSTAAKATSAARRESAGRAAAIFTKRKEQLNASPTTRYATGDAYVAANKDKLDKYVDKLYDRQDAQMKEVMDRRDALRTKLVDLEERSGDAYDAASNATYNAAQQRHASNKARLLAASVAVPTIAAGAGAAFLAKRLANKRAAAKQLLHKRVAVGATGAGLAGLGGLAAYKRKD